MAGAGWLAGFFGQVSAWQTHFYRQLTGAVRAWQAEGGAAWALAGCPAYGVFHALGPGHGKAVISSYVLANRQTARNGALLALLSSLIQALVAIALVAVLALVFDATAAVMNQATRWLELASYALVTLLGVWLVWLKALRPLLRRRADAHGAACRSGAGRIPALRRCGQSPCACRRRADRAMQRRIITSLITSITRTAVAATPMRRRRSRSPGR